MAERVVVFLQTRSRDLFPFTAGFDEAQMKAFMRDLREGLSDLQDSGSARKTSASGFVMRDRRLKDVIAEWSQAGGAWPAGADPRDPATSLGSSTDDDEPSPDRSSQPVAVKRRGAR